MPGNCAAESSTARRGPSFPPQTSLPGRRFTLTGAYVFSSSSSSRDGRGKRFRRLLRSLPTYLDQRVDQHRPNMGVEVLYGVKRWQSIVACPTTTGVCHEMGAPSAAQVTCMHTPDHARRAAVRQYCCTFAKSHGERRVYLENQPALWATAFPRLDSFPPSCS